MKLTILADYCVNLNGDDNDLERQLRHDGVHEDEITRRLLEEDLERDGFFDLGLEYQIDALYGPAGGATVILVTGEYEPILEFFGNVYGLDKRDLDEAIKTFKKNPADVECFDGCALVEFECGDGYCGLKGVAE